MVITVETDGMSQGVPAPKTILDIIKDACPFIGLDVPDAVFSSTAREHIELAATANEMAERIATDTRDWTALKSLAVITGDGVTDSFALPADYARMLKKAALWPQDNTWSPYRHYTDTDDWLGNETWGATQFPGSWTMIGNQIYIKPILPGGSTVKYYYLSNLYALDASNSAKKSFDRDSDVFKLNARVLKLGIIWQWKANKGFPYQEHMATYEEALASVSGADKGSVTIAVGKPRMPGSVSVAYPGVLGS